MDILAKASIELPFKSKFTLNSSTIEFKAEEHPKGVKVDVTREDIEGDIHAYSNIFSGLIAKNEFSMKTVLTAYASFYSKINEEVLNYVDFDNSNNLVLASLDAFSNVSKL